MYLSKLPHLLLVTVFAFLTACSDKKDSPQDQQDPNLISMGTSADMPPFEYYQAGSTTPEIIGFDIEVASLIAQKLGRTLEIKDMDFSGLIPALKSKRVQMVLASITPTAERRAIVDFSDIYIYLPVAVLVRRGVHFTGSKDIDGKKVGVQLGSSHEAYAHSIKNHFKSMAIVSMNRLTDVVQELASDRIDVAIMEAKTAREFQKKNPDFSVQILEDRSIGFAVALPKGSLLLEPINKAIAELKETGKLAKLQEKWF